jgi:hypothetical protein
MDVREMGYYYGKCPVAKFGNSGIEPLSCTRVKAVTKLGSEIDTNQT